jgi:hypothetical protein
MDWNFWYLTLSTPGPGTEPASNGKCASEIAGILREDVIVTQSWTRMNRGDAGVDACTTGIPWKFTSGLREERVVDQESAARTIAELRAEIDQLAGLVGTALRVRQSGTDRKWDELLRLLQNNTEMFDADGHRRKLALEPQPSGTTIRPHSPHRADRGLPFVEPCRQGYPRRRGLPPAARKA